MSQDNEQRLENALDLMRRMPTHNLSKHLGDLVDLCPRLTEELLSAVDQPLSVRRDDMKQKDFIVCDYNRSYKHESKVIWYLDTSTFHFSGTVKVFDPLGATFTIRISKVTFLLFSSGPLKKSWTARSGLAKRCSPMIFCGYLCFCISNQPSDQDRGRSSLQPDGVHTRYQLIMISESECCCCVWMTDCVNLPERREREKAVCDHGILHFPVTESFPFL